MFEAPLRVVSSNTVRAPGWVVSHGRQGYRCLRCLNKMEIAAKTHVGPALDLMEAFFVHHGKCKT